MPVAKHQPTLRAEGDEGASTPEILGNVALAVAVVVIVWGLLEALGIDVVGFIQENVLGG